MAVVSPILLLPSGFVASKYMPYRYTVYITEARKRLIYTGLSLFFAFLCAYTEKIALMYLITCPLQQVFLQEGEIEAANAQLCCARAELLVRTAREYIIPWKESSTTLFYAENSSQNEFASMAYNGGVELIFTDVGEAFYTLLSISLFWCLLVSLPVFVYHAWCFLQPGIEAWQSLRVRSLLSRTVLFVYLLLWLVDQHVLPRLLSFFYGFEIERGSLCLHAQIKVVSYASLYLFVNVITLALCVLVVVYRFYMERQILHSLTAFPLLEKSSRRRELFSRKHLARPGGLSLRYQEQRSKLWWGCLLFSAVLCPPEISGQLLCALLLILLNETSIWLGYISSCRHKHQMFN